MAGFEFAEAAAALRTAAARYAPEDMLQVGRDLIALPNALGDVAGALQVTVQRASAEYPIHPQVLELLAAVYRLQVQVAQAAQEVGPGFMRIHEDDLRRHHTPRPGEHMWDVRK